MNCSEIRSVISSPLIHPLFALCRRSPQLILRLYSVFIAAISRGRYLHQRGQLSRTVPTIRELLCPVNTSAYMQD